MKKALSMFLTLAMLFALAIPAMAATANPGDTQMSVGGVGFHCDCGLGGEKANTRVTVTDSPYYNDGEIYAIQGQTGRDMLLVFSGEVVDGQEVWTIADGEGTYTCACGNSDWVSFSNENKIFDGKNVQLYKVGTGDDDPELSGLEIIQEVMVTTTNTTITETWQGEKTPYQTVTQYVSPTYSSVTATNVGAAKVVQNSNHFTFAKLAKADLAEGVALDLVVGNKIDKVGTGTVKLVEGNLVLDFDGDIYKSGFGAVAFDGFIPNVKNGNIHSTGVFSHNNSSTVGIYKLNSFQSSDKKGANYDKDWASLISGKNNDGFVYLYVHFDNLTYDLGKETSEIEWRVTKEPVKISEEITTSAVGPVEEFIDFDVFEGLGDYSEKTALDKFELSDIPSGWYTVVFYDNYADPTPVVRGVEVVAGPELTKVEYKAAYNVAGTTNTNRIDLPFIEKDLVIINQTVVK